jgi:rod shape-determining protein MreC
VRRWLGRRSTVVVLIVALVVASQFSFFAPVRDVVRVGLGVPGEVLYKFGARFQAAFGVLFAVQDLSKENSILQQQVLDLEAEVAKLRFAAGENELLKKDLAFNESHRNLSLLPASVINYSPTNLHQALTINVGREDGVQTGQAVVANGFLVGKVSRVSQRTAEVWLLSNRNLITPVMLTDSQTVGLLKGSIRGLVVENIPLDTPVAPGSPVVTSALEGLYPAGIALGQVAEIISAKEEIFLTLRVVPPINPNNLTTVFVVEATR